MYLYISEMILDSKELAKYLKKQMRGCRVRGMHEDMIYLKEPMENTIEFWIQQFKIKDSSGHSEWSEGYQKNIWIKDKEK